MAVRSTRTPKETIKVRRLKPGDRVKLSGKAYAVRQGPLGQLVTVTETAYGTPITVLDGREVQEGEPIDIYGKIEKIRASDRGELAIARIEGHQYPVTMRPESFKKA